MPTKLVMTMMVRDEADIVGAMIAHHRAQGVDLMIVTDNGSVDGTTEILEAYAAEGFVDLRHDPVHRKQQAETVTAMAREAATRYGADWVLNADADEFWVPRDPSLTLAQAFARIDPSIGSFIVPVIDMTGPPAHSGTGLQRLVYRDLRDGSALHAAGLRAPSTHNAAHVGDPEVTVVQGNHFVSIPSNGTVPEELAIEVYHFPWRSWAQFERKVDNAGRAYAANPTLSPSPNHHGMRDYRSLQAGTLRALYVARSPEAEALAAAGGEGSPFVLDRRIAEAVASPVPDETLPPALEASEREAGEPQARAIGLGYDLEDARAVIARREAELEDERRRSAELESAHATALHELKLERAESANLREILENADRELEAFRSRRIVRAADRVGGILRGRSQ